MNEKEVVQILSDIGAIKKGHFVFTPKEIPPGSGKYENFHGDTYVDKDETFWLPHYLIKIAHEIAHRLVDKKIDIIVGPEKGAIGLAPLIANRLNEIQNMELLPLYWGGNIAAAYSEKDGQDKMIIKRCFAKHIKEHPGCNVWIAEDIGNSGSSARKTVQAAQELGANVVGVSLIAARKKLTSEDVGGVPVEWLALVEGEIWPEDSCPLCEKNGFKSVRTDVGHGKNFLKRKGLI